MRRAAAVAGVLLAAAGAGGCRADVTGDAVRVAFGRAFARLFAVQQAELGRQHLRVGSFYATDSCRRGGRGSPQVGAGDDWVCVELWQQAPQRVASATYDLTVRSDGCLVATGPAAVVGGPQITDRSGATVTNPLYQIDACFPA